MRDSKTFIINWNYWNSSSLYKIAMLGKTLCKKSDFQTEFRCKWANSSQSVRLLESGGVETLFGRIPFEHHVSYIGSSLTELI